MCMRKPQKDLLLGAESNLPTRALGTLGAVLLCVGLLCAVLAATLGWHTRSVVRQATEHRIAAADLLSDMKDLETGERGFVITALDNYLEPYRWAEAALDGDMNRLSKSGKEESELVSAVDSKRRIAAHVISVEKTQGPGPHPHRSRQAHHGPGADRGRRVGGAS